MKEFLEKKKRQLEIISLVYLYPFKYKTVDFEVMFNCNAITVKRDLREIRSFGVDIHSVSKKGLVILSKIDSELFLKINNELGYFIERDIEIEKANRFFIKDSDNSNYSFLGVINFAISRLKKIEVIYGKRKYSKVIKPFKLFIRDNTWRLLAEEDGIIKQFRIERIKNLIIREDGFDFFPEDEIKTQLSSAFMTWIGKEKIRVKFELLKNGITRTLNLNQKITKIEKGSKILELEVNNLEEVARWAAGRGDELIVLEPKELIDRVKEISYKSYQNHSS